MSYLKQRKKAASLVEIVITIALTSIILLEITTFISFAGNQSKMINEQAECYSIVSAIKLKVQNDFYDNCDCVTF